MLTWIVRNITVYIYKNEFGLITYNGWCAIKPNQTKPNLLLSGVAVQLDHNEEIKESRNIDKIFFKKYKHL